MADFGGKLPRRSKRLLPANFSQECVNAKLLSGELRGLRVPAPLYTFPDPPPEGLKRAWRVKLKDEPDTDYWVSSIYLEAELLKCPLLEDGFDRWYLFEPGQAPQVYSKDDFINGTGPWDLKFSHPVTPPTLVPNVVDVEDERDVVYVYTYVTEWGEETPPSGSATVSVDDAGSVTVSGFYDPVPTIEGRDFQYVRIYRTVTVGDSGAVFYVGQVDWGVDTFLDEVPDVEVSLNEQLPTNNSDVNPPDGIYGARVHPSGSIVAFKDRTIYFSEPYKPHLWNDTWRIAVEDEIVAVETWEQNIGVFTAGRPYMIYGATPAQAGLLRFPMPEPCVSYGSVVGAPEGAYYASHQGLVLFNAVGPRNITREAISKEEWETTYIATPDEMSAARYGTQYISTERPATGYIIDTLEPRIAFTDYQFGAELNVVSFNSDHYTGDIYLLADNVVYVWDASTSEEVDFVWKSKQQILAKPANFGAIMVHLEERQTEYFPTVIPQPPYPPEYVEGNPEYIPIDKTKEVMVEVYMNDKRILVATAKDREQVRLPSGLKGDAWEIRITGQCRVYSVALTETGRGQARSG